jgi:PEP-CTERM motif
MRSKLFLPERLRSGIRSIVPINQIETTQLMNSKSSSYKFPDHSRQTARRLARYAVVGVAAAAMASPAQAAFHLWNIREIYTDASGSLQFIEFFCPFGSQQFVGGQQITVTPTGGGAAHTFTVPSNLSGDTLNHSFLMATSAADAAGAPTPDYVLPANFLFAGGGTISFWGANSGTYTALPTDGVLSRTWNDGNAANSPQNFAGTVGAVVVVPEPPTWALFGLGGISLALLLRRRLV